MIPEGTDNHILDSKADRDGVDRLKGFNKIPT